MEAQRNERRLATLEAQLMAHMKNDDERHADITADSVRVAASLEDLKKTVWFATGAACIVVPILQPIIVRWLGA